MLRLTTSVAYACHWLASPAAGTATGAAAALAGASAFLQAARANTAMKAIRTIRVVLSNLRIWFPPEVRTVDRRKIKRTYAAILPAALQRPPAARSRRHPRRGGKSRGRATTR